MSSQATPQLLDARRRAAASEFPVLMEQLTDRYLRFIKSYNPDYEPSDEDLEKIRDELMTMVRASSE